MPSENVEQSAASPLRWSGRSRCAAAELAPKVAIDDRDIPDADGQDSIRDWIGRWNDAWES